ncbi:hypothetical protein [Salinigranum salinum]|uniref:hypothetical protein n=1 Tax=Salinigranum salinum TaxID=1364937 RepID=UPI0012613695|nr:hypothetical protein [Salinigranum salinum]
MSTRTAHGTRLDDSRRPSRYDLFLALLPVPLLFGLVGGTLTSVPLSTGAGLGSLPSAVLLAYGLFVDGPSTPGDDG